MTSQNDVTPRVNLFLDRAAEQSRLKLASVVVDCTAEGSMFQSVAA